jgi:hypothetical protein
MFSQITQIYFHKFTDQCFYYFTKVTNYRNIVSQVCKPMVFLQILTFVFISDACTLTHVKVTKANQNKTLKHERAAADWKYVSFPHSLFFNSNRQTETKLFIQTEKEGGGLVKGGRVQFLPFFCYPFA